ncbi:hypothetical protein KY289_016431 [Solanum tuberosum]|nr:hypothetical protein KY289_016431 [Solanum tuberosum]
MIDWVTIFLRQGVALYYGALKKVCTSTYLTTSIPESKSGEESGSGSRSGEESGSGSGSGEEFFSGSPKNVVAPPPKVGEEAKTGAQEEVDAHDEDDNASTEDAMIQFVHLHEFDPVVRQQLIDCYRSMWTINRSVEFFKNGIVSQSGGFVGRPVIPETRVIESDLQAFPDIYRTFQRHHLEWMNNSPGEFSCHLTREFYASYAATSANFAADTETTNRGQKAFASTWGPLNSIVVWGKSVDISETTINRMLHGPEYTIPSSVGIFEGKHHVVISEAEMEDPTSRERLRPRTNDNTLSQSLASLVAFLMVGYPINVGRIIATKLRDRALNERAGLPFPYLIGKLCLHSNIPPNKLVDKWTEAQRVTAASKIKDVANYLFGAKSAPVGPPPLVLHIPVGMPRVEGSSEQDAASTPDVATSPPSILAAQYLRYYTYRDI